MKKDLPPLAPNKEAAVMKERPVQVVRYKRAFLESQGLPIGQELVAEKQQDGLESYIAVTFVHTRTGEKCGLTCSYADLQHIRAGDRVRFEIEKDVFSVGGDMLKRIGLKPGDYVVEEDEVRGSQGSSQDWMNRYVVCEGKKIYLREIPASFLDRMKKGDYMTVKEFGADL